MTVKSATNTEGVPKQGNSEGLKTNHSAGLQLNALDQKINHSSRATEQALLQRKVNQNLNLNPSPQEVVPTKVLQQKIMVGKYPYNKDRLVKEIGKNQSKLIKDHHFSIREIRTLTDFLTTNYLGKQSNISAKDVIDLLIKARTLFNKQEAPAEEEIPSTEEQTTDGPQLSESQTNEESVEEQPNEGPEEEQTTEESTTEISTEKEVSDPKEEKDSKEKEQFDLLYVNNCLIDAICDQAERDRPSANEILNIRIRISEANQADYGPGEYLAAASVNLQIILDELGLDNHTVLVAYDNDEDDLDLGHSGEGTNLLPIRHNGSNHFYAQRELSSQSEDDEISTEELDTKQSGTDEPRKSDDKDPLELNRRTFQDSGTTACWFLSVLEGIRGAGWVRDLFTNGVIKVKAIDETHVECTSGSIQFTLTINRSGFKPIWQQIIEQLLMEKIQKSKIQEFQWFKNLKEADFQENMHASGMNNDRLKALQQLIPMISSNWSIDQEAMVKLSKGASEYGKKTKKDGEISVFTLDKPGHAMAVDSVNDSEANVYNQQVQSEESERGQTYTNRNKSDEEVEREIAEEVSEIRGPMTREIVRKIFLSKEVQSILRNKSNKKSNFDSAVSNNENIRAQIIINYRKLKKGATDKEVEDMVKWVRGHLKRIAGKTRYLSNSDLELFHFKVSKKEDPKQ